MPKGLTERVGKYKIQQEIGRGANAVVYQALDTTLDRIVALKVLHPGLFADPILVLRFEREAKSAAKLDHPHIVTIYEIETSAWRMQTVGWYAQGIGMVKMEMTAGAVPVPMELKEYSVKPSQTH